MTQVRCSERLRVVSRETHTYGRHRRGHNGRRGRREGPPRDCGRRAARGSVRGEGRGTRRRPTCERAGVRGVPARERRSASRRSDCCRDKLEDAAACGRAAGSGPRAPGAMDEVREGMELADARRTRASGRTSTPPRTVHHLWARRSSARPRNYIHFPQRRSRTSARSSRNPNRWSSRARAWDTTNLLHWPKSTSSRTCRRK